MVILPVQEDNHCDAEMDETAPDNIADGFAESQAVDGRIVAIDPMPQFGMVVEQHQPASTDTKMTSDSQADQTQATYRVS